MKLYGDEIYRVIPNRYPLMILHSLELLEQKAISEIHLTEDDWFFQCHYPDNPVLPLSILLESMTQTFSATFLGNRKLVPQNNEIPVISSIGQMRLRDGSYPGDIIRLEANLVSFRRGIAKGTCTAYKNQDTKPIMEIEIVEALPSQMVIR